MTISLPFLYSSSGDDGNLSGDLTATFSLCYFLCLELASASLHLANLFSSRRPSSLVSAMMMVSPARRSARRRFRRLK